MTESCIVLFPVHTIVTECLLQSYSQYTELWLRVFYSLIPNTWNCDWVPCTVLFPIHSCDSVSCTVVFPNTQRCDCASCTVLFPIHRIVTEWIVQSYSQYTDCMAFTVLFPIHSCDCMSCDALFPIHSHDCMSRHVPELANNTVHTTVLFPIHRVVTEWHIQSYSEYIELWLSALYSLNTQSCDRVSSTVLFPTHTVATECLLQSYSQYT